MKDEEKRKIIKALKKLKLYKKIDTKILYKFKCSAPALAIGTTYMKVNDTINWESFIEDCLKNDENIIK